MRFRTIPRRCQQPSIGASADGLSDQRLLSGADPVARGYFRRFWILCRCQAFTLFAPPQDGHHMGLHTACNMLVECALMFQ